MTKITTPFGVLAVSVRQVSCRSILFIGAALMVAPLAISDAQAQLNCAAPVIPGLPIGLEAVPAAGCSVLAAGVSMSSIFTTVNTTFLTHTTAFVGSPTDRPPDSWGGGVWIRGVGGRTETSATGTLVISGVTPAPITAVSDAQSRASFGGFQAGIDLARLSLGGSGWNFHAGVTGGYMGAEAESQAASQTIKFDVPFAGIYAALINASGFYIDGQLRWDFYDMTATNATVGLADQPFSGRGITLTGSVGQRFELGSGWFIEPSVGVIWSRVSVDVLPIPGGPSPLFPFPLPAGTASFDDVSSLIGRAGVRAGTGFVAGPLALQPYVTASLWHEFADDVTARFSCGVPCPPLGLDLTTSRIGTYGQFGVGIAGQIIDTGWLGYARFDYRTGENIEGYSLNAGLRYQWDQGARVVRSKY